VGRTFVLTVLAASLASPSMAVSSGDPALNLPYFEEVVGDPAADGGSIDTGIEKIRYLSIPARFTLKPLEGRRWGARIRFEASLGVHRFDDFFGDLGFGTVKAVTLMPGLELPVRMSDWLVARPYVDVGTGLVTDGAGWAFLARSGLALETEHTWRRFLFQLEPKLEYIISESGNSSLEDDLGLLGLKIGVRHPLGLRLRGRELDAGLYYSVSYYFDDVVLRSPGGASRRINLQQEVGFTLGSEEIVKIWKLSVPRIGFGYRYGDGVSGLRIKFGGRF